MIQGSRMTGGHRGMRSGISLIEMLIAVMLFGVLSVIGFKYVKNNYNTELAGKQARVSALVQQATQLTNAHDLYSIKKGTAPTLLANLSAPEVGILSRIPAGITEMNSVGTWAYTIEADLATGGEGAIAGGTETAYYFDLTATADAAKYCAVFNNMVDGTTSLVATATTAFISTTYYKVAPYLNMYCVGTGALGVGPYRIIFAK